MAQAGLQPSLPAPLLDLVFIEVKMSLEQCFSVELSGACLSDMHEAMCLTS